jgi:CheY-like chemotaxis protein
MSTARAERLLIVDDDPDLVEAYALFFKAYGYTIRTAADGVDALAAYCDWHPDVVMLDIQMPRMHGWAIAREIRRMSNDIPWPLLLAVTALCSSSEQAESLKAGFDHHFVKPAELPVILAAIESHKPFETGTTPPSI